jgi:hypothetical protein
MRDQIIDGARLYESEPDNWIPVELLVSRDKQRLVRIYRVSDLGDSFRVLYRVRGVEPSMIGEWWLSASQPSSIVASLQHAASLAAVYLDPNEFAPETRSDPSQ